MIDIDTLLGDDIMGSGALGVTVGQKLKIKAPWS